MTSIANVIFYYVNHRLVRWLQWMLISNWVTSYHFKIFLPKEFIYTPPPTYSAIDETEKTIFIVLKENGWPPWFEMWMLIPGNIFFLDGKNFYWDLHESWCAENYKLALTDIAIVKMTCLVPLPPRGSAQGSIRLPRNRRIEYGKSEKNAIWQKLSCSG